MNKLIIMLIVLFTLISCSQNEQEVATENSIYGTWELIEVFGSDGSSAPDWNTTSISYKYTFKNDGTFTSNRFNECTLGNFEVTSNKLTLFFDCKGFTTGIESPSGTFKENYFFYKNFLITSPTYLNCDEGCSYKFKKTE